MMTSILSSCGNVGRRAKQHLKQWTKPVTATLVTATLSHMTRSRADFIAEEVMLRQQLIVLNRQLKRPQLTNCDFKLIIDDSFGLVPVTAARFRIQWHPPFSSR
jgi:hypothetical protein